MLKKENNALQFGISICKKKELHVEAPGLSWGVVSAGENGAPMQRLFLVDVSLLTESAVTP